MRIGGLAANFAEPLGLLVGFAADEVFGDPRRGHPVAGFGQVAAAAERVVYPLTGGSRRGGAVHAAVLVGGAVASAAAVHSLADRRLSPQNPWGRVALIAAGAWAVLGGRTLRREALGVARALERGDVDAARERLPSLCGRDPSALSASEIARAAVESVAENTSDAVVAPLWWAAVAGLPGVVGYRAVNTLDAMVGHRSRRYRRFGWASALADDVANVVPARLTGLLFAGVAPLVGGSRRRALRMWARDRLRHPSPNSGQCEAAMAGALGVVLGGRNVYRGRVEERPLLGVEASRGVVSGPAAPRAPSAADIRRACRLSSAAGVAALALVVGLSGLRAWRKSRS